MKAISLWQPWASLIACGAKTIETRSWPTKYRGPLAIHAAKYRMTHGEIDILGGEFQRAALAALDPHHPDKELPLGCIVATARLADCVPTTTELLCWRERIAREECFGNYSTGRWAWILVDIKRLEMPVPYRGRQGLFDIPDELLAVAGEVTTP